MERQAELKVIVERLVWVRARTYTAPPPEWELVPEDMVPEIIKAPDSIAKMRSENRLAWDEDGSYWYGLIGEADVTKH